MCVVKNKDATNHKSRGEENMFQTATASESRFNANFAIDSFILGDDYRKYTHRFIKDGVCPHCDVKNHIIYTPVLPATISPDTDRMIRAKNEHEAGHARFTPSNDKFLSWSPTMKNLVNALEDERIERGVSLMSPLFRSDLGYLNREVISDLNRKFSSGEKKIENPFIEAIFAMHFQANGYAPQWKLAPVSQVLFDLAKDIYAENATTMAVSDKKKNSREFDKVVDIASRIIEKWKSNMPQNDDSQENGNGDGKGNDDSQENDQTDNSDQNENQNGEKGGKGNLGGNENEDSKDSSTDQNGDSSQDNHNGGENKSSESESASSQRDGDGTDKNGNEEKTSTVSVSWQGNGMGDDDADLFDRCISEKIEKRLRREGDAMQQYTSFTGNDSVVTPSENQDYYNQAKDGMAGKIGIMASYVEQSLRTLSHCRKIGDRDRGSLDLKVLPMIAKSLTKNIFSQTTKGISLDVAVTILVDESGSTSAEMPEYRKLAVAFSEVLERLHIPFEILGHSTSNTSSKIPCDQPKMFVRTCGMNIFEHKRFDEKYQNVKYRIANMRPHECNIDGEALLFAFKRNLVHRAARHVILVISDGLPSGTSNFEAGYKHLKDVVKVCRANGVEVYGFGIGTKNPMEFYGEECFVEIESADKMHAGFFKRFSEIIIKGNLSLNK